MAGRILMLALLLTVQVGCPHAWGRDGTIEQALKRDQLEYSSMRQCPLDVEEWIDVCEDYHKRSNNPMAQRLCPPECRPPPAGMP
jgi:hypothetical protein